MHSAVNSKLGMNTSGVYTLGLRVCVCIYIYMAHRIEPGAQRGCVWCTLWDEDYAAHMQLVL